MCRDAAQLNNCDVIIVAHNSLIVLLVVDRVSC